MPNEVLLSEANRAKLDGIVSKMIANKESDDNIKFVVEDFKKKYSEAPKKKKSPSKGSQFYSKALEEVGLSAIDRPEKQKASVFSPSNIKELAKSDEQKFTETQRKLKSDINKLEVEQELSDTEMAQILKWSEEDVKRAKQGVPSKNVVAKPANVDPKSIDRYNDMLSIKLGISSNQLKAINDVESNKTNDLKSRVTYYNNVDTQERLKNKGYDIDINGDINDEKTKSALTKESAKWQAFKIEDDKKNDIFETIDDNIDSNLISNTEEFVVDNLRKKFSGSGFIFEESGMGNYLTVKFTPDGFTTTKEIEIPLNYGDRTGLNDINAKKLKDFMKGSYMTKSEWTKFSPTEDEMKGDGYNESNNLTWMLRATELMAKNPSKYGKELIGEDVGGNILDKASFAVKNEYKWLEGEYANLRKQIDAYNQNPTDTERVAINNKLHELSVKEYNINEKANKISQADKYWGKSAAAYALEQSKKGNFLGQLGAQFVSGFGSMGKAASNITMDFAIDLGQAENLTDPITYQRYKDQGMSDEDIKEQVLKDAKRTFMPALENAYYRIGSGGSTTKEYIQSEDRGVMENVLGSLSESLGTALSGGGNPAMQRLAFFAQSYNSMSEQMRGKEFDGISESDKMLISVPFGLAVGALEKFGYDASMGLSKSGIFNKTVNTVIRKSLTDLPKDATLSEIKREINKNVSNLVKSGAIKIAAGSITEGNVEGIQNLTETGTKFLVNEIYDKDLFQNVPDITTKDGIMEAVSMASEDAALGALGGLIMSGGSISTQTYKQAKFNETSDYNFDLFYGTLMDDKLRNAVKYNTKIKLKNGEITESQAKEELESIDRNTGILRSIPTELSLRDKKDSFNLIAERNKLEQEIDGKDAALIVKQKARISEINSELNKISENATKENNVEQQKDTTEGSKVEYQGAVKGQQEVGTTEGTVGQTTQQKTDTGDSTVASRSVKELGTKATQEVNTYIAELGSNERIGGTVDSVMAKMNNAEYINDSEINSTIDTIFSEVESINNDANYSDETKKALSDKLMNIAEQLDNYEFRTKTETIAVTQRGTAPVAGQAPTTKISAEKFFEGQTAEVNGVPATFKSNKGRTEAVMDNGETVVLDTPTMKINEGDFEFDDAGALTAVTVTDRFGTTAKFTGDIAMDLAIKQRENEIGTVEQADFDTVYKEVETKYVKESPKGKTETVVVEPTQETPTQPTPTVIEQQVVAEVKPTAKTVEQEVEELGQLVEGSDVEIDRIANTIPDKRMAKIVARAAKAISRITPGVKFKIHATDAEYRLAVDESTEEDSSNGTFDPATNTIHINLEKADKRTVSHEVFHAILLNKVRTNKDAAAVTKKMIEAISSKLDGMPEFKKYLDLFASNYEENIQNEEKVSEFIGTLAERYMDMPISIKDVIYRWIDRLAKMFGLDPFQRNEVYDMLNTIARKTAKGKIIKESEVKSIELGPKEQGDGGEVGTFIIPRKSKNIQIIKAPSVKNDSREFIKDLVNDIDLREFQGMPFITNMYDYTNAGVTDLGNGLSINLFGGKGYVPYMMSLKNKNIGDVSNLAAFNTKAQAETFIRNAENGNAELFAPHSGTKSQSWQFQQHMFAELVDLILNNKLLSNSELINVFNNSIKSNAKSIKAFDAFKQKYGENINDFNSFESDPRKIVELLDIDNNFSPDLRKSLNNSISANKEFQKAIGVNNKDQFYNMIMDPMNNGVEGGEIMGVVKFDPKTFEIVKTKPGEIDHHPSFGWTLLAKIDGIYQPTNFYKSYDVTETYTKYNKDKTEVSRKAKEEKFAQKNVMSSAGAIPKVAKFEDVSKEETDVTKRNQKVSDFEKSMEEKHGIVLDLMDKKAGIDISKVVVPTDKRGGGVGTAVMNDIIDYADENNKNLTLTPSTDFGATSVSRLKEFYKRFGFVENKGSNKDFTTTASMYRKPGKRKQKLAPNGKPSKLNDTQWEQVRTPEFKKWFGDWENDPENSSKVVDENGEPLVMYHGGKLFNVFNKGVGQDKGIYFTDNKYFAQDIFAFGIEINERDKRNFEYDDVPEKMLESNQWDEKYFKYSKIYKVFLNVRKPKTYDSLDAKAIPKTYSDNIDGVIVNSTGDFGYKGNQIVVFEPNQIKLADGTNKTFDRLNADIRKQKTTKVYNASPKSISELGKRSGVVYFATDKREADAYAQMNRGKVREFEISEADIVDEKVVRDKITELGLMPKDKDYTVEESNVYELIDNRFDNSLSDSDIKKLFDALKQDGIVAFSYEDGAQVSGRTTESIAVIDTDVVQGMLKKQQNKKQKDINKVTKLAKSKGFSNEAIVQYLRKEGFSEDQINEVLAPYIFKDDITQSFSQEVDRLVSEGATEENAFNEAMDNIVYKIEDDIVREELARELMKEYGKKIKSAPRAEKIIGKAKPITITTNDVKGLNDIIKREAKAAKDKKKQIDEVIATIAAQVKDLVTKGSISIRQMSAIINALKNTNFDNQVMVDRFMDYVLKVVSNADYIERVNKGLNFKKAIKRNLNGKANPFVSVAKSFTELNPKWVVDINKYNEIAELVFNSVKPTRITKDAVNFKKEADIEVIAKYIAEEQENHLKIYEANVRDRYERITEEKSEGKTIEEMNNILLNLKDKKDYSSQIAAELKEKLDEYKKMVTNDDLAEVKAAVNVDLNLIDNKMAISILDALDTYFANGSNASLKAIMATYGGIVAVNEFNGKAKALRMLGSKKIGRVQNEQFTNINMLSKRLFRGQNAGQAFLEAIGFNNLVQGSNRAERQSVDKQNDYTKKFKNVKNFNTAENIFERNVIAWLRRRDVNANEQDSFNKRLKLLKDSVDVLRKSGTATEIAKADLYEKVFKKLGLYDDNVSIENVLGKSEKFNIDAVDFVTEMWSDIYPQLSDTSLGVYNTMLANDINYTPDKFTNLDSSIPSEFDVESSGFMSFNSNYTLDKNSAGVLMETTRPSKLPTNMYIDLDFDRNMFRSYKLALNDMYTAEAIRHTNAFLKSDKFAEIIPTAEDRRIVASAIQGYVSAKKGKNYIERSEMNFFNSFLDTVGGFGAARALAGFSQFINQWTTANVNTLINAGEYMRPGDLFNKDIASMIANSGLPISNVGIEALTTIENADKELEKAGIVATVGGVVDKYTLSYLKKSNAFLLKQLLANPDRFARVQAFAAYYRKSMAQQGLKADFKAPMNEKAAKYAQSMIDANMDVSDTEMRGQFFKSKNAYVKIIKQVFFPFATFSMNQRNRVWSDFAIGWNKLSSKEDKIAARRSLAAFSAEFITYNAIRYGVGLLIMKMAVAALGLDDEEEEKIIKKYEENLMKSIKSSSITDVLSPTPVLDEVTLSAMNKMMPMFGIGTPTEEEFQKYIDEINEKRIYKGKEKLTEDEVALKKDKFMLDEQFQFYIDNEKSTGMLGIQFSKIQELYDIVDAYYTGKYSRERFAGGGYEEVSLSDDAKESLKYIALLKLEGTLLGPRETDQIANRMFKIVKDTKTLTEAQKSKYDVIKKDYEIDPYKMSLIKTTMKTENVLKEIEYIESTGGLTEKQSKEYAKLRAFGEIDGWGLDDIRKGKTAKQIIASRQ